jgi:uncharacterized protein (TIRG00374 family)
VSEKTARERNWRHLLRRSLYWIIPVVVLYLVFQQIDFDMFKLSISKTNVWMVAFGVILGPLIIAIGAWRWCLLLTQYHKCKVNLIFTIKHYWIGLALGTFVPSSIGWDMYRVVASGRRFGQYTVNIVIIVVEKLMALIACMSLIVIAYPLVPTNLPFRVQNIFHLAHILLTLSVLLIATIVLAPRNRVLSMWVEKLGIPTADILGSVVGRFAQDDKTKYPMIPLRAMIKMLAAPKQLLPILILSWGIQFVSAVRDHIFFRALGYDLPFIVNLFTTLVLFFAFLLPISFGSLGIREGASILLYGLFGVPAETVLLVSFFNRSGVLLNNLIGGFLMMLFNVNGESFPRSTFQTKDKQVKVQDSYFPEGTVTLSGQSSIMRPPTGE